MRKTAFLIIFACVLSQRSHLALADCSRFVPTPIWNFTEFMQSSWTISGLVDTYPQTEFWYLEMGSSWNPYNENTFEMWTYGTMIDKEGQQMAFDGWFHTQRWDANRPGDLLQFFELGEEIYSNTTILYYDTENILWVQCYLDDEGLERGTQALMGSKSRSLPDLYKEQFKSILKFDYGMDVDNNYVDIPQYPFPSSPSPSPKIVKKIKPKK